MKTEDKIIEEPLGCNCDLKRGFCGEITFANKIILCDDCTFKLIEKVGNLEKALQSERARIKEKIKKLREPLADLEHRQWVHLIDFLMDYNNSEGNIMDKLNSYEERGLLTEYTYLTEEDKEKDRVWADKVIKELLKVIDNSQQKNIDSEKVGVNPSGLVKLPSADKIVEEK